MIKIWDSESDEIKDVTEDYAYVALTGLDGVLILASYHINESRTTSLAFIGPNSEENAKRWAKWSEEEEEEHNINIDTKKCLALCFGLGD